MTINEMHYESSITQIISLYKRGLVNDDEFLKAEEELAKKYCIPNDNLIRKNYLINSPFRVMYIHEKEEILSGEYSNNQSTTEAETV